MFRNLYSDLGLVDNCASQREVLTAYRRMARMCHPDMVQNPFDREMYTQFMVLVNAAFEVLSDPQKRHQYDQKYRDWRKNLNTEVVRARPRAHKA